MNDYVEVRVDLQPCDETITDVAAALLADAGFESFLPDSAGLTAYIPVTLYSDDCRQALEALPFDCKIDWRATTVEGQDWNHEWEKNYFKPIVVGDQCLIHSSFHRDLPKCKYDITIDPKMAFGTGHHSTTSLMLRRLLDADLEGSRVVDMGTGTGILALLAAMRGAAEVTGIEIDEAAYVNAIDNVRLNGHPEIRLIHGCAPQLEEVEPGVDYLLANINRNVITGDLGAYAAVLRKGGEMFLSGFYTADAEIVDREARRHGLELQDMTSDNDWACLRLVKE